MMAQRGRGLDTFTFGGRVPWAIGLVLVITVAASLFVAFGSRHAAPLFELAALVPAEVWRGQVWRLVTWFFIEPEPLGLIFGCLFLYWFGRELATEWGSRRFLVIFGGVGVVASTGTCLVALIDRAVLGHLYLGGWAIGVAMTVAWGLWFPDRVIRIWFILPLRGRTVAWITIGITVILAIYRGWERYLPELFAEGSILVWLFRRSLVAQWSTVRRSLDDRRRESVRRDRAKKRAKGVAHLRLIESRDDDPGPLSPELEGKIDNLLGKPGKPARKDDLN